MSNGPSKNLTWGELACKDGTSYPQEFIDDGRIFNLATVFERIRMLAGNAPIIILSAYRTPTWNRKIGGARNSQHLLGRALDLKHSRLDVNDFYKLIRDNVKELGVKGLGRYPTFVHIDIRNIDKAVYWSSGGVKDDNPINA